MTDQREALATPSSVTPDLRVAIEREIAGLSQSDGLHQYDRGIHRMPGCAACDLRGRLAAALASVTPSEPTQGQAFGLYIPADTTGITIDGLATTSFEPGSIRSTRRDAAEPDA